MAGSHMSTSTRPTSVDLCLGTACGFSSPPKNPPRTRDARPIALGASVGCAVSCKPRVRRRTPMTATPNRPTSVATM
jgi:hypothetical protein